ncbi:hypothetical protein GCM10025771_04570 [Niveibacterium umoris]|uniref:DUF2157 domain-containing protein n=1 Tax=Niveibacterium umoris TaxID=1193620 RepID=A0A840BUG1_9RHOO|nr:DUF2157 domain-containing protein [Niveibacterium umoris]MBB4013997.1 hypothetical protein [Niveibacterium umoris]
MTLRIQRADLDAASQAGLLPAESADALWQFLAARRAGDPDAPRFDFTHVLYYLGGLLAIGAMSLFMTLGWEQFGGWGIFFIALLYAGVAWKLAERFERMGLAVPSGIMAALIVVLVPLAVWGLQNAFGLWAEAEHIKGYRDYHVYIDWRWITLEFATLVAGTLMLYRWRTPFLVMPIAVTLWYMSMDLAVFILAADDNYHWSEASWTFRKWFSLAFGLIMLLVAFWVELRSRSRKDYPFWLYLFGLMAFWGGLSSLGSGLLSGKLIYLAINLLLIGIGAVLVRRTFVVFGALGVAIVLGDLSHHYFRDSWLFPLALTAIGLGIVFAGVAWRKHEARLTQQLRALLPDELRRLIEARQATR